MSMGQWILNTYRIKEGTGAQNSNVAEITVTTHLLYASSAQVTFQIWVL